MLDKHRPAVGRAGKYRPGRTLRKGIMNVEKQFFVPWILVLAACSNLSASPIWPADANWTPITIGGAPYIDVLNETGTGDVYATPPRPNALDLVGGIDSNGDGPFATGFWYTDNVDLMFRLRVDGNPKKGRKGSRHVWTVLLNTDAYADVDWALSLDNRTDKQVELVAVVSGGPTTAKPWNPVILRRRPQTGVAPLKVWSRFVNATAVDGSNFHRTGPDDNDYFVDMAFPSTVHLAPKSGVNSWPVGTFRC